MLHTLITSCTIVAVALAGCSAGTAERVLLRGQTSRRPEVRKAPYDGEYRLYATAKGKPTTRTSSPLRSERMKRGERIGFARDNSGRIVVVVRDVQTAPPLTPPTPTMLGYSAAPTAADAADATADDGSGYTWTVQPDGGQIDRTKTALLIAAIVAIGVGVGVGIAVAGGSGGGSMVISGTGIGGL